MHFCRSADPGPRLSLLTRRLVWAVVGLAVVLPIPAGAQGAGFRIERAQTRLVDDVYLLDADIDIEFSPATLEALSSGVAITMILDIEILQPRKLMWDKKVASLSARYQLQLHALTGQYILRNLNSDVLRVFRTIEAAMRALGTLRDFPMLDGHLLARGQPHELKLRARLDIEALPAPLRPMAYLSSLWRQSSEWSTWSLTR